MQHCGAGGEAGAEEGLELGEDGLGVGDEIGVGDFEVLHAVAGLEHLADLAAVFLLHADQVVALGSGQAVVAGQHGPLGIDHLGDWAHHIEDGVPVRGRKAAQQCRDHLHHPAGGLADQLRVFGEFLDFFPFPVALGIVLIGRALAIGEDVHATGFENLHHQ